MEYYLTRSSRRKHIAVQVKNAQVYVQAPLGVPEAYLSRLLQKKSRWLLDKVSQQQKSAAYSNQIIHNGQVWLNGKLHQLKFVSGSSSNVLVADNIVTISFNAYWSNKTDSELITKASKILLEHFKRQTDSFIHKVLPRYSQVMQVTPKQITIKQYRARWGSCNSKQQLSFNSLMAMLPTWVAEYIVVHELAHLIHLNHSKAFWQLVARYCPDYLQAKEWLTKHQYQLQWSS